MACCGDVACESPNRGLVLTSTMFHNYVFKGYPLPQNVSEQILQPFFHQEEQSLVLLFYFTEAPPANFDNPHHINNTDLDSKWNMAELYFFKYI